MCMYVCICEHVYEYPCMCIPTLCHMYISSGMCVYTCTHAHVDVGEKRQEIFSDLEKKEKFLRKKCSWAVTPG